MLFSKKIENCKKVHQKLVLTVHSLQCYFPTKKIKNHSSKNSISGTQGTMLFSKESAKLKVAQSKTASAVLGVHWIFPESGKLKIAQSKISLTVPWVLFSRKDQN